MKLTPFTGGIMCGIDELFSSNSLEEKTEFSERFIQVLDEFGVVR